MASSRRPSPDEAVCSDCTQEILAMSPSVGYTSCHHLSHLKCFLMDPDRGSFGELCKMCYVENYTNRSLVDLKLQSTVTRGSNGGKSKRSFSQREYPPISLGNPVCVQKGRTSSNSRAVYIFDSAPSHDSRHPYAGVSSSIWNPVFNDFLSNTTRSYLQQEAANAGVTKIDLNKGPCVTMAHFIAGLNDNLAQKAAAQAELAQKKIPSLNPNETVSHAPGSSSAVEEKTSPTTTVAVPYTVSGLGTWMPSIHQDLNLLKEIREGKTVTVQTLLRGGITPFSFKQAGFDISFLLSSSLKYTFADLKRIGFDLNGLVDIGLTIYFIQENMDRSVDSLVRDFRLTYDQLMFVIPPDDLLLAQKIDLLCSLDFTVSQLEYLSFDLSLINSNLTKEVFMKLVAKYGLTVMIDSFGLTRKILEIFDIYDEKSFAKEFGRADHPAYASNIPPLVDDSWYTQSHTGHMDAAGDIPMGLLYNSIP